MSFIWDCIALIISIGLERRGDLRKEVLTLCSSERCQVVRNGGSCKLAWEELLQRPNAHRKDVDADPNVPEVSSSQEEAHLLSIPQRAGRNHPRRPQTSLTCLRSARQPGSTPRSSPGPSSYTRPEASRVLEPQNRPDLGIATKGSPALRISENAV